MWTLLIVSLLLLVGCEGQPTPFPAQLPTESPVLSADVAPPSATSVPKIRYAIDPSLANIPIQLQGDYQIINATEPIFADDLGISYDIAISSARTQGWQTSPIPLSFGLILRPSADFADIVWRAIDPPAFIPQLGELTPLHDGTTPANILRTEMANLGKPDGFVIWMGVMGIIGEEAIQAQLRQVFIETRTRQVTLQDRLSTFDAGQIDMVFVSWFTEAERAEWVALVGEANFLPLFSEAISYIARPDLNITLSSQGLPEVSD